VKKYQVSCLEKVRNCGEKIFKMVLVIFARCGRVYGNNLRFSRLVEGRTGG
jgi:hypothetical protein